MNTKSNTLTISPEILALKDVTTSEKMLLALYTANPGAKDFQALQILGVSLSGLKKIRKRLFDKKLLKLVASGYRVLLPGDGHFVSQSLAVQKGEKVAPRTAAEVADDITKLIDSYDKSRKEPWGMRTRTLAYWSWELTNLLAEAREVFPTDCADLLAPVERCRDYWAACCYAGEIVKSQPEYDQLAIRLRGATDQQLALLYERIQSAQQLGGGKAPLLLAGVLADDAANKA